MGRRRKAPEGEHRAAIAAAAGRLFARRGLDAVTVDDIAREAGYSKATLYVYFRDKDEIVLQLTLGAMEDLYGRLAGAVASAQGTRARYDAICAALTSFEEEAPFSASLALSEIRVDPDSADCLPVERELYETGERINEAAVRFLREGVERGELRGDLEILPTIFLFWASLTGLVRMAGEKRAYLEKAMGLGKREFLRYGFETLYRSIEAGGDAQ